jgi:hypothetical protein
MRVADYGWDAVVERPPTLQELTASMAFRIFCLREGITGLMVARLPDEYFALLALHPSDRRKTYRL